MNIQRRCLKKNTQKEIGYEVLNQINAYCVQANRT